MELLQLSAAHGPDECCLAVAKALACLLREARGLGIDVDMLESEAGARAGTYRSVLLSLDGAGAEGLAADWEGSIQWICASPYRPGHARKNWFIGALRCEMPTSQLSSEIRFETTRSSGPGGQHVNKTESAVRATHVATGITVKVQTERSQHANKRIATLLIAHRLANLAQALQAAQRAERRQFHHQVERGGPRRVFKGENFVLMKMRPTQA
ncbi:Peptide chain release factor RF1 [Achromobacter deleyi]|uniref:Peptide chain release factor RF1 n=1 Tax=Achromobacter deleyi TaxID=1353891 RepID=A0A6S7A9Q9_9BURK|nr:peptide chain release factor H [Achromobacter deleyi]CAB3721333.1 Peptide chain release factor RF1 [Achromobacter deleyi]CAB3893595.1 Peptide chain release factor RF1 [Achromobacter deleyi]CAB3896967.1 Peptide chain release factor RF1 [Achromobacter deleyi]